MAKYKVIELQKHRFWKSRNHSGKENTNRARILTFAGPTPLPTMPGYALIAFGVLPGNDFVWYYWRPCEGSKAYWPGWFVYTAGEPIYYRGDHSLRPINLERIPRAEALRRFREGSRQGWLKTLCSEAEAFA